MKQKGIFFHLSDTRPVRTASLSVFGESVARCRETVASRTRGLTVLLRDLAALIHRDTVTGIQEVQFHTTLFHKKNMFQHISPVFNGIPTTLRLTRIYYPCQSITSQP